MNYKTNTNYHIGVTPKTFTRICLLASIGMILILTNKCRKPEEPSMMQLLTSQLWSLTIDCSGKLIYDEDYSVTSLKANGDYIILSSVDDGLSDTWSLKDNDRTLVLGHEYYTIITLTETELKITSETSGCTLSFKALLLTKATTIEVSAITDTSAVLHGILKTNNSSTEVKFEYGTSNSYGSSVSAIISPVPGPALTNIDATLLGLIPGTVYHYRVKAINSAGAFYGQDLSFQTFNETTLLPVKLIAAPPVYLEEMDATTGWTFEGTGELNMSEKQSGIGAIKLTSGLGAASQMSKTVAWNLSPDNAKSLSFWVYPHSDPVATITSIVIYAGATSALTNYFQIIYTNTGTGALVQNAWNFIREETTWLTSGWTIGAGNPNWNNIGYLRIQVVTKSGQVSICSFDALSWGATIKPSIIITSDDGWASNYTKIYPLLSAKNMVATSYVISDLIGTNNFMTSSQLSELYTHGWDIGNHSNTHVNFTSLTQAEIETELNDCKTVLDGLGLTRASNHVAYPSGGYDADVLAAMISSGGKSGRSVMQTFHQYYPVDWPYKLHTLLPENTTTLAAVESYIVETLKLKGTPIISFHEIVDASPTRYQWLTSDFGALVDFIEAQGLQTLTIEEYYKLYSGPITVNHK